MRRIVSCRPRVGTISLSLFVLCALLPADTTAQTQGAIPIKDTSGSTVGLYKESHALVIGVSDYTGGWPRLPGVKEDIRAVTHALEQNGFQVVTVENPDHTALPKAYQDFLQRYGLVADNRLLFYFMGHGYTHKPSYATNDPEEWMGYIVSRDAPLPSRDFAAFLSYAMSMQEFDAIAQKIEAKHALFVFDSCFSGAIFALSRAAPLDISLLTIQPVRQFISSGGADQDVPDRSEFRRQFLAALEGEADRNHDGYITGSELGAFLYEKVTNYSHGMQTPQYGKIRHPRLDRGDFVFPLTPVSIPAPPSSSPPQASIPRSERHDSSPPPQPFSSSPPVPVAPSPRQRENKQAIQLPKTEGVENVSFTLEACEEEGSRLVCRISIANNTKATQSMRLYLQESYVRDDTGKDYKGERFKSLRKETEGSVGGVEVPTEIPQTVYITFATNGSITPVAVATKWYGNWVRGDRRFYVLFKK